MDAAVEVGVGVQVGVAVEVGVEVEVEVEVTCSKRVAKKFSAVRMPPLGPSWYCFMTSR